ncbi:tetratricopeptide repeat protein [Mangrovihabitans endophyticus]|uniref:Tetratricopeptide repeat-containing protein n=1 Tax=Mangrovihabitans endophyticus TaxID=1751298 RepID=A0A8J3C0L7_9ACTN|nr:tetratricopeptide repeat protein [Mangrovihabitans endophyticus]GGL01556.1 hypothetical protein GCM10012284_40190 [Mangrovihabitans endophyticus]
MNDARRSADHDLAQARAALARGEMSHAAGHLAGAIAHAPTLPETHELLSLLAARADGGLDLFPLERHAFVGTIVARAHLLAAAGRPEDGLPLLVAASGNTPGTDWAGVPWVSDPALAVRMEPSLLARVVMQLCTAIGDPAPLQGRDSLRPYLTLMRHAVTAHPGHALLLGAGSALARRLGETRLAVDWAELAVAAESTKLGEIWLGYAYRSAGRTGEALEALGRAVAHDPDDLSVYADIAATLADDGRLDEALSWADRALARDPTYDCAVHTAGRLRFRADGDLTHLVRVADFQRDHPDDAHEHTDLADCCRGVPWLGHVPPAGFPRHDPRRRPPVSQRPSAAAIERLRRVASPTWGHPPTAYDAALGLVLVEPDELLALLIHTPPVDPGMAGSASRSDRAWWERTARVWACLGLLHHGADEPWACSARRRRLVELVSDGTDQITEAALFALVVYAWVDPAARIDVAALITRRLIDAARGENGMSTASAWSIAQMALATPEIDPAASRLAASMAEARAATLGPDVPQQRRRGTTRRLLRWLSGGLSPRSPQ